MRYAQRMATKRAAARMPGTVIVRSGKWWTADLPSFPGAHGQGKTREEAYGSLLSAVRDLIDAYAADAPKRRAS